MRETTGRMVEVEALRKHLQDIRRDSRITTDDIVRAVDSLQCLGGGFCLLAVGTRRYISSIPLEFGEDQTDVVQLFSDQPWLTVDIVSQKLGWSKERAFISFVSTPSD